MNQQLSGRKFGIAEIRHSLKAGWHLFQQNWQVSVGYASIFALIGLVLLGLIGIAGVSPLAWPLTGGFMLIGPLLLCGFFTIAEKHRAGEKIGLSDALLALPRAPAALWVLALACTMLFLVWITDAATLYAFMIGGEHLPYHLPWLIALQENVVAFELWGSLMGSVIAFIIFAVSAFSVPLLYHQKAELVPAITISVKTVFSNFASSILWGLILSIAIMASIFLMPLFPVVLPVMAFASFVLYEKVFADRDATTN